MFNDLTLSAILSSQAINITIRSTDDSNLEVMWNLLTPPNINVFGYFINITNLRHGSAVKREFLTVNVSSYSVETGLGT